MKIAIVHEMLIKLGGAEKVLEEFMKMYPEADIFTLMYDEKKVGSVFPRDKIHCTGPAQWLFKITGKPRASLPLMPWSIRSIDVSRYDLVISSSSGFAHGVKIQKMNNEQGTMNNEGSSLKGGDILNIEHGTLNNRAKHVCYCHSPARYLWDATDEVQAELGLTQEKKEEGKNTRGGFLSSVKRIIVGTLVKMLFWWLRRIDLRASKSPDMYIANSREVQDRIQKYYQRDAVVLWPPVEISQFVSGSLPVSERPYYVLTSALTPFKKVDRAVRVMSRLGVSLKIIGDGAQRQELQEMAGDTVQFLGRISDEEKVKVYMNARGFLMPQKEDAGIAPIEAMAAGIPVFGLAKGGLLEVHIDGVTGRFFPEETDESFEQHFLTFDAEITAGKYDNSDVLIHHARIFDTENFRREFRGIIQKYLKV